MDRPIIDRAIGGWRHTQPLARENNAANFERPAGVDRFRISPSAASLSPSKSRLGIMTLSTTWH
jgi:hypothetical protein